MSSEEYSDTDYYNMRGQAVVIRWTDCCTSGTITGTLEAIELQHNPGRPDTYNDDGSLKFSAYPESWEPIKGVIGGTVFEAEGISIHLAEE